MLGVEWVVGLVLVDVLMEEIEERYDGVVPGKEATDSKDFRPDA